MKRTLKIVLLLVLTLVVTASLNGPALAQNSLSIDIGTHARLVDGGQAVELKIRTVCAIQGVEVLEAFVYVTQNGNQSQFAPIPVSCSHKHRPQKATVNVPSQDFLFQEGDANASAYVLVFDPITGIDYSAGAGEVVRIR